MATAARGAEGGVSSAAACCMIAAPQAKALSTASARRPAANAAARHEVCTAAVSASAACRFKMAINAAVWKYITAVASMRQPVRAVGVANQSRLSHHFGVFLIVLEPRQLDHLSHPFLVESLRRCTCLGESSSALRRSWLLLLLCRW